MTIKTEITAIKTAAKADVAKVEADAVSIFDKVRAFLSAHVFAAIGVAVVVGAIAKALI